MRGLVVTNLVWTERSTELSEMCEERTRYLNDFQIHWDLGLQGSSYNISTNSAFNACACSELDLSCAGTWMCTCMHVLWSPNRAQLKCKWRKRGSVCIYRYIHALYTKYMCQNTLESTAHLLQSAWKSNAEIRICFVPLPYFFKPREIRTLAKTIWFLSSLWYFPQLSTSWQVKFSAIVNGCWIF